MASYLSLFRCLPPDSSTLRILAVAAAVFVLLTLLLTGRGEEGGEQYIQGRFPHFRVNESSHENTSTFGQLAPLIIEPKIGHAVSLVFLHGIGERVDRWHDIFLAVRLPHVRYVFPQAPTAPVSLFLVKPHFPKVMPAWFNISDLTPESPEDEAGIRRAAEYVHTLVEKERSAGVPVLVGGFSQGGALALYYSLTKTNVHGCLAFSTWMPLAKQILQEKVALDTMPIFQSHGSNDSIVTYQWGKSSHEMIKKFYKSAEFKTYNIGHTYHPQVMADANEFISLIVPPK